MPNEQQPLRVLDIGTGDGGLYLFHNPGPEHRYCVDSHNNSLFFVSQMHIQLRMLNVSNQEKVAAVLNKRFESIRADARHLKLKVHFFDEVFDHVDMMFPFHVLLFDLLKETSKVWNEIGRLTKKGGSFRIVTDTYSGQSLINLDPSYPEESYLLPGAIPKLVANAERVGFTVNSTTLSWDTLEYIGTDTAMNFIEKKDDPGLFPEHTKEFHLVQGRKR